MNPPFNENIAGQEKVARGWVTWFLSVAGGGKISTPSIATTVPYQNTTSSRQQVIYTGGTVSAVAFSRDGVTYYALPTAGVVVLAGGDYIKLTFTVLPNFTVVPI